MERKYKGHKIVKNANGKWIVTYPNGSHSQHHTIIDAKAAVNMNIDQT